MLRRLLPVVAVVLTVTLGLGACADDVAPAARVGDLTVSEDDFLEELEAWAGSPTLLQALQVEQQVGSISGEGVGGHAMAFVDLVLSYRVNFELHNEEFAARELELSPEELEVTRATVLGDQSEAVLEELGEDYADRFLADVARLQSLQQNLGEAEYNAWLTEAFARPDIDVNPRYGAWDPTVPGVLPPEGPRGATPEDDLPLEL